MDVAFSPAVVASVVNGTLLVDPELDSIELVLEITLLVFVYAVAFQDEKTPSD